MMEYTKFTNKDSYKEFLKREFEKLNSKEEYNIFLHCVTDYTSYFGTRRKGDTEQQIVNRKVFSIRRKGLNLDGQQKYGNYGTINGTMRFVGNSKEVDIDKVIDYDYFSSTKTKSVMIFAFPKNIKFNNQEIEFSTLDGKADSRGKNDHTKNCVFDMVKPSNCPKEFLFAFQRVNQEDNSFVFSPNTYHFSVLSNRAKQFVVEPLEKEFNNIREKFKTDDIESLLKETTNEHNFYNEDYYNEP